MRRFFKTILLLFLVLIISIFAVAGTLFALHFNTVKTPEHAKNYQFVDNLREKVEKHIFLESATGKKFEFDLNAETLTQILNHLIISKKLADKSYFENNSADKTLYKTNPDYARIKSVFFTKDNDYFYLNVNFAYKALGEFHSSLTARVQLSKDKKTGEIKLTLDKLWLGKIGVSWSFGKKIADTFAKKQVESALNSLKQTIAKSAPYISLDITKDSAVLKINKAGMWSYVSKSIDKDYEVEETNPNGTTKNKSLLKTVKEFMDENSLYDFSVSKNSVKLTLDTSKIYAKDEVTQTERPAIKSEDELKDYFKQKTTDIFMSALNKTNNRANELYMTISMEEINQLYRYFLEKNGFKKDEAMRTFKIGSTEIKVKYKIDIKPFIKKVDGKPMLTIRLILTVTNVSGKPGLDGKFFQTVVDTVVKPKIEGKNISLNILDENKKTNITVGKDIKLSHNRAINLLYLFSKSVDYLDKNPTFNNILSSLSPETTISPDLEFDEENQLIRVKCLLNEANSELIETLKKTKDNLIQALDKHTDTISNENIKNEVKKLKEKINKGQTINSADTKKLYDTVANELKSTGEIEKFKSGVYGELKKSGVDLDMLKSIFSPKIS